MTSSSTLTSQPDEPGQPFENLAISVSGLSKAYQIYAQPRHRLWQSLWRGRRRFYQEFHALREVSFDVSRGEVVGIVGRNGSGKSTLLQLICGTLTPSTGRVVTRGRIAALLELGAGFNPEFTGRENVYFNGAIMGLTTREVDARYSKIIEFADIGGFVDQPVKTYSTGMAVRLAFAVIAHVDADVLVIDEALAVGDAFFVQKCMRFLRDFVTQGNTILFVSHDTGAITSLCQRALWLHNGQLLVDGTPKEVVESYLQHLAEETFGAVPRFAVRSLSPEASAPAFGRGGARITRVELLDDDGRALPVIAGGEKVTIRIRGEAVESLASPIIGFVLKDRLGQVLFSDNTFDYRSGPAVAAVVGHALDARFTFQMPILAPGEYTIGAAIADGTQATHVQHHWIHDALAIRSVSTSVATGLVGIPMLDVSMDIGP